MVSYRIHGLILTQQIPFVKTELGYPDRVSLVRLHRMDRDTFLVVLEQQRIQSGNKETRTVQEHGDRFIVSTSMLHDHPGFSAQTVEFINQHLPQAGLHVP